MVRQLQIALLLVCVFLLGSDVQTLACELSCAADTHQSQHDPTQNHSHRHSSAVSDSADLQPKVPQATAKGTFASITDQHDPHSTPGCAAADHVTLSVPVIAHSNTVSHSIAAIIEDNTNPIHLAHRSAAEFDSPPQARSAPQHRPTPLRI
jgi:hypothetical protein